MKKILTLIYFIFLFFSLSAQNTFSNTGTNVGIGTNNPQALLHVKGSGIGNILFGPVPENPDYAAISFNGALSDNNWNFAGTTGADVNLDRNFYINRPSNYSMFFREHNYTQMSIIPGGNVGIGTAVPFTQFSLGIRLTSAYPNYSSNDQSGLNYYYPAHPTAVRTLDIVSNGYNDGTYGGSEMRFLTNSATSTTVQERMRIDRNGNVGIGITNPINSKIHVQESEAGAYGMKISNRNNSQTWGLAVDIITPDDKKFSIIDVNTSTAHLTINNTGNVGIGTTNPTQKLSVKGTILATKVKVSPATNGTDWPDYVFNKEYKLRSLASLETYINQNKHLPDVPTAKEVTKAGLDLAETQAVLLRKIEELTLYVIELGKENKLQQGEINTLKKILIEK